MVVTALQLTPPLVELNAPMAVSLALAVGTITVPSGRTTGCPPMMPLLLVAATLQLRRRQWRAHLHPIARAVIVPFSVAIAIEGLVAVLSHTIQFLSGLTMPAVFGIRHRVPHVRPQSVERL